ncbi:hypothetical protein KEM54_001137, partial [Ascosphaera aggregata]
MNLQNVNPTILDPADLPSRHRGTGLYDEEEMKRRKKKKDEVGDEVDLTEEPIDEQEIY